MARNNRRYKNKEKDVDVLEEASTNPLVEQNEVNDVVVPEEGKVDELAAVSAEEVKPEEQPKPVEVKKEVKVETPKEVAKPAEVKAPVIDTEHQKLNSDDIKRLLKKPGVKLKDKIDLIAKNGTGEFRTTAAKLKTYSELFKDGMVHDIELVASKNRDLLNLFKNILNAKDKESFKLRWDIVNSAFLAYNDAESGLNLRNLHKGDHLWKNQKDLKTLNILTVIISDKADKSKRNINNIDFNKALNTENVNLNASAINRVKEYYKA
jgi:hypothetical protein